MPAKNQKKKIKSLEEFKHDLENCGTWYVYKCAVCGTEYRIVYQGCGHRFCKNCAREFSRRLSGRIAARAKELLSKKRNGYALRLITLTLRKSDENLRDEVRKIIKAAKVLWKNFLHRKDAGLVASVEIGPSKNIHLHCLYYGPYITQTSLSIAWKILTDSPIVDIRLVRGKPEKAAREVVKYSTKILNQPIEELYNLYKIFYGMRRVCEFGVFVGTATDEPPLLVCPICGDEDYKLSRVIKTESEAKLLRRKFRELYKDT